MGNGNICASIRALVGREIGSDGNIVLGLDLSVFGDNVSVCHCMPV